MSVHIESWAFTKEIYIWAKVSEALPGSLSFCNSFLRLGCNFKNRDKSVSGLWKKPLISRKTWLWFQLYSKLPLLWRREQHSVSEFETQDWLLYDKVDCKERSWHQLKKWTFLILKGKFPWSPPPGVCRGGGEGGGGCWVFGAGQPSIVGVRTCFLV